MSKPKRFGFVCGGVFVGVMLSLIFLDDVANLIPIPDARYAVFLALNACALSCVTAFFPVVSKLGQSYILAETGNDPCVAVSWRVLSKLLRFVTYPGVVTLVLFLIANYKNWREACFWLGEFWVLLNLCGGVFFVYFTIKIVEEDYQSAVERQYQMCPPSATSFDREVE